jgi:hypothetical protein
MNLPAPPIINVNSTEAGFGAYGSGASTGAWPANNRAFFVPFSIWEPIAVTYMFIWNITASGNIDLGIYTIDGTRLASTGSTALSGNNTTQGVALSLELAPGRYYMGVACSTTGYTAAIQSTSLVELTRCRAGGCVQMDTAFPLPATATFAELTSAYVPMFGLSTRSFI